MNEKKKKKNKGGAWGLLIFVLIWLINAVDWDDLGYYIRRFRRALSGGDGGEALVIGFALLVLILGISVVAKAAGKARARREETPVRTQSSREKPQPSIRLHSTHPAVSRQSFSEPDPYCLVCEQTGEDHFARDRAQRIAQLDTWLKNGIIDRAEYRALKDRYEHDR